MSLFRRKSKESDELPQFVQVEMLGELAEAYPHVQLLTRPNRPGIFVGVRLDAVEAEVDRGAEWIGSENAKATMSGTPDPYQEEDMEAVAEAALNNPANWVTPDGPSEDEKFSIFELDLETGKIVQN